LQDYSKHHRHVDALLRDRLGLRPVLVPCEAPVPGSYWGAPEAGLIGDRLFVRADTPVHSVLHEAAHYVCMDADRRARLHTDAGGDESEENAVCYLQVLLADQLVGIGRDRLFADMDAWGYSFRLGSSRAWFEQDAEDARGWLLAYGLMRADGRLTWALRQ
jgi:hypothetical protein